MTRREIGEGRDLAIAQRNVDVLAFVRKGSCDEGGKDRIGRVETCSQVCDRDTNFCGRLVRVAGYVHETHFAVMIVSSSQNYSSSSISVHGWT